MSIDKRISKLVALQAKEIKHTNNSLLEHLKGTYDLLKSWGASSSLCDAGLFHAAYGTDGFNVSLLTDKHRDLIREIIGLESEEMVYLYCSCDRDYFWPKIGNNIDNKMLNRFTKKIVSLSVSQMKWFCELTVANEVEISKYSDDFILEYGNSLLSLFQWMKPYLTKGAIDAISELNIKYNQLSIPF